METGLKAVVGRGLVEILPDFRKWGTQLAADMRTARAQLDGSAAGLRRSAATVGTSMAKIGKGTGALAVGVAAISVKMATDFQAHTAVLQTAAGETAKGLKVVRAGIESIAVNTGTGLQNLTDGMYQVEKAGYRGGAGLKVLNAAAQGAREEGAKLSDVTNAMTSVMASYHLKATDSVRVMNAMKTAAGEGKITMEEFSGALSTVLPIASANKIAFEDVAGSMATLTQHGTSAREATHELAATIRALASPNNVASREMARFGLSSVDVSSKLGARGLSGTVNMLVETILHRMGPAGIRLQKTFEGTKQSGQDAQIMLKSMSGEQKKLAQDYLKGTMLSEDWNSSIKGMPVAAQPALRNFKVLIDRNRGFSRELKNGGPASQTFTDALKKMSGGAIGLNTILQLTGESAKGNAERIAAVGKSYHDSSKSVEGWKTTAGLLKTQIDRMKMQVQVLAVNLGTKLIPVVSAVVGLFVRHRSILLAVMAATGAFLTVATATYVGFKLYAAYTRAATIATAGWNLAMRLGSKYALGARIQLAALFVWQKLQATWTGIVTAAQWAWNLAMTANPIGLIIAGIALLVGAIIVIATKTKWFQKLWSLIWGFIKRPVLAFVGWLKDNWQLVVFTILTGGIGLAVAMIVRHWDGVKHIFGATLDWVKKNWPWLLGALGGPIGLAVVYIIKHWDQVKKAAVAVYHAVVGWFFRLNVDILKFFIHMWAKISGFFSNLPGRLGNFFSGLWAALKKFFTSLPGRVISLLATLVGWDKALVMAGGHLIVGLFHGATKFFKQSVPAFFKMLWHGIVDFFKAVFGIHSPSTVMAVLGGHLIMGLFAGILRVASGIVGFIDTHIVQPVFRFFRSTVPAAAKWMKDQVIGFFRLEYLGLLVIWGWVRDHVLMPIWNFFTKTIPAAAGWLKDQVIGFFRLQYLALLAIWGWIRDNVLMPIWNFFTKTIPAAAGWLKDQVTGFFRLQYLALLAIWGWIRDNVLMPLWNFFTKTIPEAAGWLRDRVVGFFRLQYLALYSIYASIRDNVFNPIGNFFTKTIPGWALSLKNRVVGFFGAMRDGIGVVWAGIESKVRVPVNWVFDHVWNHGILAAWKKITGWIGIGNKLGIVPLLAQGGTLGDGPAGIYNRPTAIVGEGRSQFPEYVIPSDPRYRARALALWQAAGAHFYAGGGILGTIDSALSSAFSGAVSLGTSAAGFLTDPVGAARKLLARPLSGLAAHIGHAPWARMLTRLPHTAVDGLMSAVGQLNDALFGSSGGSGVQRWSGVVRAVLRQVGQPAALLGDTLRRMNQESGGNPNAVNRTDVNWRHGTPSVGLMQVIGPTFRRYAGPYRSKGPFLYGVSTNPAANVYASMRYALSRYGSLASAYDRPGGYALGTGGATAGWHLMGESGPEMYRLPAGTRVRSSRDTARRLSGTTVVHLTVENHGVIGSRHETENWLAGSLEQLRRQGRLPTALGGR